VNSRVDLTNCDREPIHIPGSIQAHGALLACDANIGTVLRHSANIAAIIGTERSTSLNGARIEDLFGDKITHELRNALANANVARRPALIFGMDINGRRFDVSVHRSGEEAIVEFEPTGTGRGQPLDVVRTVIARVGSAATVEQLVADTVRLIRAVLGYDRVMIYRFEDDGSGQVISEAKISHLESFLGQYFPASDIPQQARALYLKNTIRIIMDADGERVPLVPELDAEGRPLDLSHAHLRSVSPIHCEYLRNMGVAASMSISIVIDGTLWGLVACHHYAPKHLDMAERVAVEMFGEFLSLHLNLIRQKRRIHTARAARQTLDVLLRRSPLHDDVGDLLRSSLPEFSDMLRSDGVGLWIDGNWTASGTVPPADAVGDLVHFLNGVGGGRVWSSHTMGREHAALAAHALEASGVLAIPLSQRPRDYLIYFRKEFEHTLNWAGNPEKSYETGPLGDRLTPRKSFAIWKEAVKNQSRPWTDADLETSEAIRAALVEVVLRHNEVMAEERGKADVRQRMLNEELNHRVKNILAVIKSLVGQASPPGRTLEEYLNVLRGRFEALAVAHDQVVRGDGGGFLRDLLRAELKPYGDQASSIVLEGPPVWVDTTAFSVLALVFHELATNAAKYGALSRPGGRLVVSWSINEAKNCELVWQETGGPAVEMPKRRGFGSILITRSVPHDLGGESELEYLPEGLRARFVIPARSLTMADGGYGAAIGDDDGDSAPAKSLASLDQISILLVEDQMLIAMDAETMLSAAGLSNVVTVSSVNEALSRLKTFRPAAAVLDVNLGIGTSLPIATELQRNGTPFIFATGYGDSSIIPNEFSHIRIVRKPYTGAELATAIMSLIAM
jgi:light-regulated signal transduction histidine kinase (bacteriophytochrome)/CheY-like chemotaxis protein